MNRYVCGIDAGSNTVKVVILDDEGNMAYQIAKTGSNSVKTAEHTLNLTLSQIRKSMSDLELIVSTGYGRNYIEFANRSLTEISCHTKGVYHLFPDVRTIIDIGGQDNKVIYLNPNGNVQDFTMNDKCAAGTGRFLEVIASALGVDLEKMGELSLVAAREVAISSTCTVFAESEVVGHIARGEGLPEIVAGVQRSIVRRILGMAQRRTILPLIAITGGVAKNKGVVAMIEEELEHELVIPPEPQITGALGAALLGLNEISK